MLRRFLSTGPQFSTQALEMIEQLRKIKTMASDCTQLAMATGKKLNALPPDTFEEVVCLSAMCGLSAAARSAVFHAEVELLPFDEASEKYLNQVASTVLPGEFGQS